MNDSLLHINGLAVLKEGKAFVSGFEPTVKFNLDVPGRKVGSKVIGSLE